MILKFLFEQPFIIEIAEWSVFPLIVISIILTALVIRRIGKGVLNVIFFSYLFGIFFFGLTYLFILLTGAGFYQISEASYHFWWHLIFYLSMLSFIWGGYRLKEIASTQKAKGWGPKDMIFFSLIISASLFVFILPTIYEQQLQLILEGSTFNNLGIHHFIAFLLALAAMAVMVYIKNAWGKLLSVSSTPMIIFLSFMTMLHLWELLAETYKVVHVSELMGEAIEQFIVIPGLFFFIYAIMRVIKATKIQP